MAYSEERKTVGTYLRLCRSGDSGRLVGKASSVPIYSERSLYQAGLERDIHHRSACYQSIMAPYIDDTEGLDSTGTPPDVSIAIDRGGAFCDVIASIPGREDIIFKLLSEDPSNYPDAPTEAIRRVLEVVEGRVIPVGEKLDGSRIGVFSSRIQGHPES